MCKDTFVLPEHKLGRLMREEVMHELVNAEAEERKLAFERNEEGVPTVYTSSGR